MSEQDRIDEMAGTVAAWLKRLIDPDQIVEIRALKVQDGTKGGSTWAGTFCGTELDLMARCALQLSGFAQGVYYTLNPIRLDRFVSQAPRVQRVRRTTEDADIIERRWLLIDVDPVKPAKHKDDSATDREKAGTLKVAREVASYLQGMEWPDPVLCDSGNGHHLLYRFEPPLPAAVQENDVVRRVLTNLSAMFSGPDGKIDTGVFNPSRIVKFPGTRACKGQATEERPHRRAGVLELPQKEGVS
jgi:hypothetical protein